jgi:excisionase family DNA binding protein
MNETNGNTVQGSAYVVSLTVPELQKLIREEVYAALRAEPDHLLTVEELAEQLRVPVSWVYEQSRQGKIPTIRVGRYVRFSLRAVLESQKTDRGS